MATSVREPITHQPVKRTAKIIWTLLAGTALIAAVTVVVVLTTGTGSTTHLPGPGTVVGHGGHAAINQCLPTRFVHPC